MAKSAHKAPANYDFESNYSNVLSQCRLKLRDFFTNYDQIVPYARDFLPIKFFFLFCFFCFFFFCYFNRAKN